MNQHAIPLDAETKAVEALAQAPAHLAFDERGAGEEAQPQAQIVGVVLRAFDDLGFGVERDGVLVHLTPPRPRPRWPGR